MTLDISQTWKPHKQNTLEKAKAAYFKLLPILNQKNTLSIKNKLLFISSVMSYTSIVWGYLVKIQLDKLLSFERRIIRLVVNATWFIQYIQIQRELSLASFQARKIEQLHTTHKPTNVQKCKFWIRTKTPECQNQSHSDTHMILCFHTAVHSFIRNTT